MMKTILVPTDFSQDAHDTLLFALEIASRTASQILLFHAFYQPLSLSFDQDFTTAVNELERQKTRELEAYAEKFRSAAFSDFSVRFNGTADAGDGRGALLPKNGNHPVATDGAAANMAEVPIRCVSKFGFAFDEILKAVDVHQPNLVVMGMRGEGALRRAWLGRTTINVMRDAKVPVLAVPLDVRFKGFSTIVFATDLLRLPSTAVLHSLRDFVKLFDSTLQVLHLYHENSLQQEKEKALGPLGTLVRQMQGIDYSVVFQQHQDVAEGVQLFVREQHADLLVLLPQQHPFLEKLLSNSLTQKISAKAFVPLLALPSGTSEILTPAYAQAEAVHR